MIELHIEYFAALREQAGLDRETLRTEDTDARNLYARLAAQYGFNHTVDDLKLAVNDTYTSWNQPLGDGDRLVFIPPVSGG